VVHRELTAANIILVPDKTEKLSGFGLTRAATDVQLTQASTMLGELKYMAPEQVKGLATLDGRSDIYSAGAVLYEAVTGAAPFDAEAGTAEPSSALVAGLVCRDGCFPRIPDHAFVNTAPAAAIELPLSQPAVIPEEPGIEQRQAPRVPGIRKEPASLEEPAPLPADSIEESANDKHPRRRSWISRVLGKVVHPRGRHDGDTKR
jgi:serine/threonine protein kinase